MKLAVKVTINREFILSKVTEYDIYRQFFGDFTIGKKYLNHLRGDKKQPSFSIGVYNGHLYHVDFGSDYWRGNCFDLVQQIYRCDYKTCLKIICQEFGMTEKTIINPVKWLQPEIVEKDRSLIQVKPFKTFTKEALKFWERYEIGASDLANLGDVEVFNVKDLYINKEKIYLEDQPVFGFLFQGEYWKIYSPYSKKMKWISNVPLTQMWGLSNIKDCGKSFVVKSVKDYIVWRKFISTCTVGVQNESSASISDENINYIKNNSKECYVVFDNEEPGVKACKFYNDKGLGYWNVPKKYYTKYGIKDPSDLVDHYSSKRLQQEVKKKIDI